MEKGSSTLTEHALITMSAKKSYRTSLATATSHVAVELSVQTTLVGMLANANLALQRTLA